MSAETDAFLRAYDKYRVEDQRRYYEARFTEYAAADRESELMLEVLLVGASFAGFLSIWQTTIGYAAAVLSAIAIIVSGWSELIGFQFNAGLFASSARDLRRLRAEHDAHRSTARPEAYVADIESVLLGEVRSWGRRWSQTLELDDDDSPPTPEGTTSTPKGSSTSTPKGTS